jgi:hypothetical protein
MPVRRATRSARDKVFRVRAVSVPVESGLALCGSCADNRISRILGGVRNDRLLLLHRAGGVRERRSDG